MPSSSNLVHVLHLGVLVRLRRLAIIAILAPVFVVIALHLHLNLLTLPKLVVAFLDEDSSAELFRCGGWREVT